MADRKRRTAPSREFIREREESSRNRRPSRNRYQEEYDSDEEYDDYDDEYEDDYDEDYDDYDEDYEDENFEEEPQSLKRRKSQRQGANIATATGRSDRRRNPSGAENRKAVSGGNSGRKRNLFFRSWAFFYCLYFSVFSFGVLYLPILARNIGRWQFSV